jgi:hypothetical protein
VVLVFTAVRNAKGVSGDSGKVDDVNRGCLCQCEADVLRTPSHHFELHKAAFSRIVKVNNRTAFTVFTR